MTRAPTSTRPATAAVTTAVVRRLGRRRAATDSMPTVITGAMPRLTTVATLTPTSATEMKYSTW